MRRCLALSCATGALLVASACAFDRSGVGDDTGDDAPPDAPTVDGDPGPDAPPDPDAPCGGAALGFAPANVDRCALPPAIGSFAFPADNAAVIDTSGGVVLIAGQPVTGLATAIVVQLDGATEAMVIAADDLSIPAGGIVTVRGTRPLIVVAYGTLSVAGRLDASGARSQAGAGADLACALGAGSAGQTQLSSSGLPGGTGGGGGAFGTGGGTGARVSLVANGAQRVQGGVANGSPALEPLRGGCSGGPGGVAIAGVQDPAPGGGGGGALQLVAGAQVAVTGVVTVSGGGGSGATSDAGGGGGGGSGGALLVHTPALRIQGGRLTANGGGGGEGRRNVDDGVHGEDGLIDDDRAAVGGEGTAGGNGGAGAVGTNVGGNGSAQGGTETAASGGGGGGGGVGRIQLRAGTTMTGGGHKVSPPASTGDL